MSNSKPYLPPTHAWSTPKCCFPCKIDDHLEQINTLINNMPPALWKLYLSQMYIPFLHRLTRSDPKRRMPPAWIAKLPARRPPKSLRRMFYDVCALGQRNPSLEGEAARPVLIQMHAGVWQIMHFLTNDNSLNANTYGNLWAQMEMLNGTFELLIHFNKSLREHPHTGDPVGFARFAMRSGADEYMLGVIEQALADRTCRPRLAGLEKRWDRARERMEAMQAEIKKLVGETHGRRLALGMALHARLGRSSSLGSLSEELLLKCMGGLAPELVQWGAIAQPWLTGMWE